MFHCISKMLQLFHHHVPYVILPMLLYTTNGVHSWSTENQDGPVVNTLYGPVEGVYLKEARAFLGVPYATPPTGDLRWQPPKEPRIWAPEILPVNEKPPGCPQKCGDPKDACPETFSEDCLYMNIYTPIGATLDSKFPVMMYLHGGNFRKTGASGILFDGRYIANKSSVILVATNNRLGALGWMLTEQNGNLSGNFAFLDQCAALTFVKKNIAGFGGDPKRITLFGQSSGAQSIFLHLISPESEPLFHQAIIQSNPLAIPYKHTKRALKLARITAEILQCTFKDSKETMACLRSKAADDIVDAQNEASSEISLDTDHPLGTFEQWGPVIDEVIIPKDPFPAFLAGKFQCKPIIIGTTSEEARIYIYKLLHEEPRFLEIFFGVVWLFPGHAIEIARKYHFRIRLEEKRDRISEAATDYMFMCPTIQAARSISTASLSPQVYHYVFDQAIPFPEVWGKSNQMCAGHACHGGDLPFLFQTHPLKGYKFTNPEQRLADKMLYYWANFVHAGNPNNGKWRGDSNAEFPAWPMFCKENNWQTLILDRNDTKPKSRYREKFCKMWDDIGYD